MQVKNKIPALSVSIQDEYRQLLKSNLLSNDCCCFVIKITNHELLSVLLNKKDLTALFEEIQQVIISTINQTPHPIIENNIISFDRYIVFRIKKVNQSIINHLSYLIYHNIQIHIPIVCPSISLECKISSINLDKDDKNHEEKMQNLFCNLSSSKCSNYYIEFNEAANAKVTSDVDKLNVLKKALLNNTFSFAYQPIVDRATGDIPYYECLLRIPNEKSELVSAGLYIELAERAGLNSVVDQVVFNMAINELKAAPQVTLAVNISNSGIIDPNLFLMAQSLLSNKSIAARLVIEITETSLNVEFEKTKKFADIMRNLGCKIALDDFGSGFTSFKQLQNLPVDIIKIDGSFIRDVVYNKRDQHLVISLIDIAKNLNARTVAEFVENGEIAKFLLDVGIDYMQGNFFSPALNYRTWNKG